MLPASTNHRSISCTLTGLTLWHGLGNVFIVDVMFNFEQRFTISYYHTLFFLFFIYSFYLGFSNIELLLQESGCLCSIIWHRFPATCSLAESGTKAKYFLWCASEEILFIICNFYVTFQFQLFIGAKRKKVWWSKVLKSVYFEKFFRESLIFIHI